VAPPPPAPRATPGGGGCGPGEEEEAEELLALLRRHLRSCVHCPARPGHSPDIERAAQYASALRPLLHALAAAPQMAAPSAEGPPQVWVAWLRDFLWRGLYPGASSGRLSICLHVLSEHAALLPPIRAAAGVAVGGLAAVHDLLASTHTPLRALAWRLLRAHSDAPRAQRASQWLRSLRTREYHAGALALRLRVGDVGAGAAADCEGSGAGQPGVGCRQSLQALLAQAGNAPADRGLGADVLRWPHGSLRALHDAVAGADWRWFETATQVPELEMWRAWTAQLIGTTVEWIQTARACIEGSIEKSTSLRHGLVLTGPVDLSADEAVAAAVLTAKEGCCLLGALLRCLPLQKGPGSGGLSGGAGEGHTVRWLVPAAVVGEIGEALWTATLALPHMGAVGAAAASLEACCARLLATREDGHVQMVGRWRQQVLCELGAPVEPPAAPPHAAAEHGARRADGINRAAASAPRVEALLRRSTGGCAALLALLRPAARSGGGEEGRARRRCVGAALRQLIGAATAGAREEGRVATAQMIAMDAMTALLRDRSLSEVACVEATGENGGAGHSLLARSVEVALRGAAAPEWGVRNAAAQLLSVLTQRLTSNHRHGGAAAGGGGGGSSGSGGSADDQSAGRPTAAVSLVASLTMHPGLEQVLSDLVQSVSAAACVPWVGSCVDTTFALLLFVGRFRPTRTPHSEHAGVQRRELLASLCTLGTRCAVEAPQARLREAGARAIAAALGPLNDNGDDEAVILIITQLARADGAAHNARHGLWLRLRQWLRALRPPCDGADHEPPPPPPRLAAAWSAAEPLFATEVNTAVRRTHSEPLCRKAALDVLMEFRALLSCLPPTGRTWLLDQARYLADACDGGGQLSQATIRLGADVARVCVQEWFARDFSANTETSVDSSSMELRVLGSLLGHRALVLRYEVARATKRAVKHTAALSPAVGSVHGLSVRPQPC
jgi:hypothetical protein